MIALSVYPKSYSKYYDNDTSALVYESTIHSKYKGEFEISLYGENSTNPSESLSNWQNAYLSFSFDRNNVIADGSTDVYTIQVPNGCRIIREYTTISNGGKRIGNAITYNTPYSSEEDNTNTIVMRCSVNQLVNNKNKIIASVEVEETIGDKTFTYMDGTFEQSLQDYYEKHPLPIQRVEWKQTADEQYLMLPIKNTITDWSTYLPVNKTPLTDWNFLISGSYAWFRKSDGSETRIRSSYDVFNIVWLQNIVASNNAYADEIISYVSKSYPDEASITNANIELPGFKTTKYPTADGEMWKYEIAENFVGYARTAAVDFTKYNYMYFSTDNANTLDEAFKMYLDTYQYQGVDKEELRNLVNTLGVSNILNRADANGDIYIDGKRLFHYDSSDNRLELINNKVICVPFASEDTMKATLESELAKIYEDISASAIMNSKDVINSLVKNSTQNSNKESYSEYFIVQDGNDYQLVNVYSTGTDYTYVTVSNLDAKLENDTLSFSFSSKNEKDLLSIVNALDEHLIGSKIHTSLTDDDYLVVTASGDVTNVVYGVPNPNKRASATYDDTTTGDDIVDIIKEDLWNKYNNVLSQETIDYIFGEQLQGTNIPSAKKPGVYIILPVSVDSNGDRRLPTGVSYNRYFVIPGKGDTDQGKYLLFNVYIDGSDKVYVTVSVLASKEENGTLSLILTDNNETKLNNIVKVTDAYFGTRLDTTINDNTMIVSYAITSTASINDSVQTEEIKEVSSSLKFTKVEQEYLEVVSDEKTIDEESNSIINQDEEENKKYSNTQDTETNNTTEETEETSNDGSYVPSSDASNVDTVPSSDGGTNLTSSITDEVVEVNSSPTNGISLVEAG